MSDINESCVAPDTASDNRHQSSSLSPAASYALFRDASEIANDKAGASSLDQLYQQIGSSAAYNSIMTPTASTSTFVGLSSDITSTAKVGESAEADIAGSSPPIVDALNAILENANGGAEFAANLSADQLEMLRKAYLPLLSANGQLSLVTPPQNNKNDNRNSTGSGNSNSGGSPTPLIANDSFSNNNSSLQQRPNNNVASIAAMVSALSGIQPQPPPPHSTPCAEDPLALLQQQLMETLLQQQHAQSEANNNNTSSSTYGGLNAGLLAAALTSGNSAQSSRQRLQGGNLVEMALAALLQNGNDNAVLNTVLAANSGGVSSDILMSVLANFSAGNNASSSAQPDISTLLAAASSLQSQQQQQLSFGGASMNLHLDLAARLAGLNNNDSKLASTSPAPSLPNSGAAASHLELLNLIGSMANTSPELLATIALSNNNNNNNSNVMTQPMGQQAQNSLSNSGFAAELNSLLQASGLTGNGAQSLSDVNSAIAQLISTNGGSNNNNSFGYSNSPNKSFETYCEICDKYYCNRYFLKTHKQRKHGICSDDASISAFSPTKGGSAPTSVALFSSSHPSSSTQYERTERTESAGTSTQKRLIQEQYDAENDGSAPKIARLMASNMQFSTGAPSVTSKSSASSDTERKTSDVFDFTEQLQKQSLAGNMNETALAAAAALFDTSASSTSAGTCVCDMCAKECESNVALIQHKFTVHAAALLPIGLSTGTNVGSGSNGATDDISPPQSSSSSIVAADAINNNNNNSHANGQSTGNYNGARNNIISLLSQQLPMLLSPQMIAQLSNSSNDADSSTLLATLAKLTGLEAFAKNSVDPPSNVGNYHNANNGSKPAPKRQYTSTSKNYCDFCKKDVCNKYFLRTHMLKMHKIVIDENKPIIAKIDTNEKERAGAITFRCDICMKEHRTRTELKQHKTDAHGIMLHGTPPTSRDSGSTMRTPKSGAASVPVSTGVSMPPRISSNLSLDSSGETPPPRPVSLNDGYSSNGYQPQSSSQSTRSQPLQTQHDGYYGSESGNIESPSDDKGVTNFLAPRDECTDHNDNKHSMTYESNNNKNYNNNNNILKIEMGVREPMTGNFTAEQLEHMLSTIAAAAAVNNSANETKKESSDGDGSAGVSSPSTSSSTTFDMVSSAAIHASTATVSASMKEEEPYDAGDGFSLKLPSAQYKEFLSQLVATPAASNNNNGYGIRPAMFSSMENNELLRQVALRIQQESHQKQQ